MADNKRMQAIRSELLLQNGGSLYEITKAKLDPQTDYVFISLGGMGLSTMLQLKTKITRECEVIGSTVHYLALDTSSDEVRNAQTRPAESKIVPLTANEAQLLQSGITGDKLKLNNRVHLEASIKKWLNPNMDEDLNKDGASGVRQCGRYFLASPSNHAAIRSALTNIKTKCSYTNLQVYFIAGIAGGTGSGGFIDLAYLIRDIFDITTATPNKTLKAFLYLPDTRNVTGADRIKQYRNGCAALKELNYFMNLSSATLGHSNNVPTGINIQAEYRFEYGPGDTVVSRENIFDFCTLVSGQDISGLHDTKIEDATTITVAAAIVNQLVSAKENNSTDGDSANKHTLNAKLSNKTQIANFTFPDKNKYPDNANFCYMAVGYSEARLPTQECIAYATNIIFKKMSEMYDNAIDTAHENNGARPKSIGDQSGLTSGYMRSLITNGCDFESSFDYPAVPKNLQKMLESDPGVYEREWDAYVKILDKHMGNNIGRASAEVTNKLLQQINAVFASETEGPFHAIAYMRSSIGGFTCPECILPRIENIINTLDKERVNLSAAIDVTFREMINARNNYKDAGMFQASGALEVYTAKVKDCYQLINERNVKAHLINAFTEVYNNASEENHKKFEVYTQVLRTLSDILKENNSYVTDATLVKRNAGATFCYNPVPLYASEENNALTRRTNNLIKHIEDAVNSLDLRQFMRRFFNNLTGNAEKWYNAIGDNDQNDYGNDLVGENQALVSSIREFFKTELASLTTLTLDGYLSVAYSDSANPLEAAAQDIYTHLNKQAEPLFRTNAPYDLRNDVGGTAASYYALCVPDVATSLLTEMLQPALKAQMEANNPGINVYKTSSQNTIYLYKLYYCLPAYMLQQLQEAEVTYDKCQYAGNAIIGTHLEENPETESDWRDFPMVLTREMWAHAPDPSSIPHEHEDKMRDRVNACAKRAIELGIVKYDDANKVYTALVPLALLKPNCEDKENGTFAEFNRDDFIAKHYNGLKADQSVSETYPIGAEGYALLCEYMPCIVINLTPTFKTFAVYDDDRFALDLRNNMARLFMLERIIRLYEYAMAPVAAANETIGSRAALDNDVVAFLKAYANGAIKYNPQFTVWSYDTEYGDTIEFLEIAEDVPGYYESSLIENFANCYYIYEGFRKYRELDATALGYINASIAATTETIKKETKEAKMNGTGPSQTMVERNRKRDALVGEAAALLASTDKTAGGLADNGRHVKPDYIKIFHDDPERGNAENFDAMRKFYVMLSKSTF